MSAELTSLIERCAKQWDLPDLANTVSVRFSSRLRRSLGRCRPSEGRIVLSSALREAPVEQRAEVLCHELAHVAAYRLHGPAAKPHGPEWRELVSRAGFKPHIRSASAAETRPLLSEAPSILPYEHRCPVCQNVRYARRPVARWRCAECLEAGLPGELVITRRPIP